MENKTEILRMLKKSYEMWIELIASLPKEQINQRLTPSDWTIKDVVAHLWSWQNASVARAEAALKGTEPQYPGWWIACGPDPDEDVDRTNAYLYAASKDKTWSVVYTTWKEQFAHYLELLKQIPEADLLEVGKFKWMGKYALSASALGSWDHHQEHYDTLTAWLKENRESR